MRATVISLNLKYGEKYLAANNNKAPNKIASNNTLKCIMNKWICNLLLHQRNTMISAQEGYEILQRNTPHKKLKGKAQQMKKKGHTK